SESCHAFDAVIHIARLHTQIVLSMVRVDRLKPVMSSQCRYAIILAESVKFENEPRRKPAVKYVADFVYQEKGQMVVEDVKSTMTRNLPVYRLKKHLMKSVHGLEIREI